MTIKTHAGYVAIMGRPNVGKSTLLNRLIGQKISITSRKPQTTRHRILGIKTLENTQILYIDMPGLHQQEGRALNRYMNKTAIRAIHDVDVVLLMIDGLRWDEEDEWILRKFRDMKTPILLVVNKVDRIKDKERLLPFLEQSSQKFHFAEMIPISAQSGANVEQLEQSIIRYLPESPFYFPENQITDRSERFLTAEIIREKMLHNLGAEVPYAATVVIEEYKLEKGILRISAVIYVERDGQKSIVIGEKGERLKQIGTQARLELEQLLDHKIFLQLWVKVKKNWADDEQNLRQLGYES